MKPKHRWFLKLGMWFFAGALLAQMQVAQRRPAERLGDYLRELSDNNPALKSAEQNWKAAVEGERIQGSLPDPELAVGYFIDEIETRLGPQEFRLGVRQKLPLFGKRALAAGIAGRDAERLGHDLVALRLQLFEEFITRYAEFFVLGAELEVTREHLVLLNETERVLLSRYETGRGSYGDILKLQLEIDRIEDRIVSLRDRGEPLAARLNVLLGRDSAADFPFPESIPGIDVSQQPVSTDRENATNPVLASRDAAIKRADLELKLAGRARFPDLMVGIDWIAIGDSDLPLAEAGDDAWSVKLGVNVPLWTGKNRARVSQAQARRQATEWARRNEAARIAAEVADVAFQIRDLGRRIVLFQESLIPKAREALDVVLIGFESGEAAYLDLIDAETDLLELQIELLHHRGDRLTQQARLDRLLGKTRGFAGSAKEVP